MGLFELDGNTVDSAAPGDDWDSIFLGTNLGTPAASTGILSDLAPLTIFTQGGSKDINDVSEWRHTDGSVPDKDDITNAYATAYVLPNDVSYGGQVVHEAGDLILYFGLDRYANNGDAFAGFWFFQDDVGLGPDKTFQGVHTARDGDQPGDLLVLVEYPQGSNAEPIIKVYEWDPLDADNDNVASNLDQIYGSEAAKCDGDGNKLACAITNVNALTNAPAWPYTPKSGPASDIPKESFFEGGINVTQLLGGATPCFSSFLAETRSSRSETAQLKDFVLGNFDVCNIAVTKNCAAEVNSQDGGNSVVVNFSGEVSNNGGLALNDVTVTDDMGTPGDTADDQVVFGPATLQPGETQPYNGSYETTTIPATDVVTATATRGAATIEATAEATCSPEVNPAITVDKVCTAAINGTGSGVDVLFNGTVTNTGNVALEDVTVVDDNGTPLIAADDVTVNIGDLAAGASAPYSGGFGSLGSNTSTDHVIASGTDVLTETEVSANAQATCLADINPQATLFSVCESRINASGTGVEIQINGTLTNTGNVLLNAITLLDDNGTPANLADDVTLFDNVSLALGASLSFSRTYTGLDLNAVTTLSGTFGDGLGGGTLLSLNEIAACPPEVIRAIQVTKQCTASVNGDGTAIDVLFNGTVTNTGNLALENVDVVDDNGTPGNTADDVTVLENATLAPGASLPFNGSFNSDSPNSTDVVTASGEDVLVGVGVSDTETASCSADVNPSITVTKQCTAGANDSGTAIEVLFNGTVTNSGNVVLENVDVVDDNGTPGNTADDVTLISNATLAVGASLPFNGSFNTNSLSSTDVVTASGVDVVTSQPVSDTESATCSADVNPSIAVTKQCTDATAFDQPILFNGTVSNTGDVVLVGVTVVDDNGTPGDTSDDVTFPIADLAPGASANYNGSYSPGTGTFTNTVLASASDAIQSGAFTATASATCDVPPPPPEEEGCTPGFWKNSPGSWTGYTPNQLVGSVFSLPNGQLNNQLGDDSLIEALGYPGGNNLLGAAQILLRAAVASLLNTTHPEVDDFPLSTAEVIAQVNAALATKDRGTILALASQLDGFNNLGCDLPNDNSF